MRFTDPRVQWLRKLPYAEGGDPLQRLDILKPLAAARPCSVLINIHGGGWFAGTKGTQSMPLLMHMARCGWLVIDADYRLSPKVAMPEHLIDVKRVIAWARAHAAEHGGDPDDLVLTGGSAGGHLPALASLTANRPEFQPGFESADTSVQAALPLYGKYNFLGQRQADAVFERFMLDKRILPGPPSSHAALWRAMDPAKVHADAPPFLLLHSSHDAPIPAEEARWFAQLLRAVSCQPGLYAELPHAQHAWEVPHSLRSDLTVEALIHCSGYRINFPFLDPGLLSAPDNDIALWQRMVDPRRPGLFFVDLVQPKCAMMPIAELQSSFIADLLQGGYQLPSSATMETELRAMHEGVKAGYTRSESHTIQIDCDEYSHDLYREWDRSKRR